MISRVQSVHACGYLHRDMKPDNFLMGLGPQAATVFLVDFGLAKRFLHPRSRRHVPARDGKRLSGTPRYCSLANHAGLETARRDDMEALGYVLLYLARGSLPWQGLKRSCRKDNFIAIAKCKMQLPLEALCAGLPSAFGAYLRYCRELAYDTEPEYAALRLLFTSAATEAGFAYDGVFDWSRAPCK